AMVGLMNSVGLGVQIELENAGNHDHGLRAIAILVHREFQGFGAVDEQATAEALLILGDPVAVAVLADAEEPRQRGRATRGRFVLAHDTSPSSYGLVVNGRSEDRRRSWTIGDSGRETAPPREWRVACA